MNSTAKIEIRALASAELDEVSGGVGFMFTAGPTAIATTAQPKKLALRIMSEHMERQTQVVQKATS